jgi:hypothetical protein
MEILLASFASKVFYKNQQRLAESAKQAGITRILLWKYIWLLGYKVFWKNLRLFRSRRGAGYWAWHATVIRSAFNLLQEGDIVIFCDAGLRFINKVDFVKNLMKENHVIFFSTGNFTNRQYTKRDTFIIMHCDEMKYWDASQIMGGFHIWKKCSLSYQLLDEYEKLCLNYQAVSDAPNKYGKNFPEFVDHRHPQSIMSLLAVKYSYKILPFPISYGADDIAGEGKLPYKFLAPNRENKFSVTNYILNKIGLWY